MFIHNAGLGKTYHVSMASVTNVSGKSAADILAKQGKGEAQAPAASDDPNRKADQPKEKPSSASQGGTENYWQSPQGKAILGVHGKKPPAPPGTEGPIVASYPAQANAWAALQSHGWSATKKDSDGTVTFSHPKLGGQFRVGADGSLINTDKGTKLSPGEAAGYLKWFHHYSEKQKPAANRPEAGASPAPQDISEKQAEGAAKQKAAKGAKPSNIWMDYDPGDTVVAHDGSEWEVVHGGGPGVYAQEKGKPGGTKLIKWNEIAKHTPKKGGPGSRGSTKWYYDAHGHVQYGEPPNGVLPEPGEPPSEGGGHGLKVGDAVQVYGHEGKHTVSSVSDLGVILTDDEGHKLDPTASPKSEPAQWAGRRRSEKQAARAACWDVRPLAHGRFCSSATGDIEGGQPPYPLRG